jgi:hypothetical protein
MKSMPLRISEVDPEAAPRTFTAMMLAFLAMPKVVEAAVPAQWVLTKVSTDFTGDEEEIYP